MMMPWSRVVGSRDGEKKVNSSNIQKVELTGSKYVDGGSEGEGWMKNDFILESAEWASKTGQAIMPITDIKIVKNQL